jgi:hypothetical protein
VFVVGWCGRRLIIVDSLVPAVAVVQQQQAWKPQQ